LNTSLRELLLRAFVAVLGPVAAAEGAILLRSPTLALPREQSPALLLFPENDAITERANDRVTRELTVRLTALARGDDGAAAADQLLVVAHRALFADVKLGGLVLGLKELDTEWDLEDADATACAIPARYRITYRTLQADLSTLG